MKSMARTPMTSRDREQCSDRLNLRHLFDDLHDLGSKTWGDIQWEKGNTIDHYPCSDSRTTFFVNDLDETDSNHRKIKQFERLFCLQHGFGHTYEDWGTHRVRIEDHEDALRALTLLSRTLLNESDRHQVVDKVMNTDLRGFSRYYGGLDGAVYGLALRVQYAEKRAALDSVTADIADEVLAADVEALADYVWRTFDGDLHEQ